MSRLGTRLPVPAQRQATHALAAIAATGLLRLQRGLSLVAAFYRSLPTPPALRLPALRPPVLHRLVLPRPRMPRLRMPRLRLRPATVAAGLAWAVLGVALFTVYLHMSRTVPVNSDGASNALQAWAMLHGNPLLRGWQLSDVSFYTTELPQYMLLEAITGLRPDVVHLAGAMTYTLLVLGAALLAKGKATGGPGFTRASVAVLIMLAPQHGDSVYVLLLSPDHVGTAVPVLAAWILLDRGPRRWYVPVATSLLLGWALVADNIVLITGIAPLVAVGALRFYQAVIRRGQRAATAWFEILLVVTSLAAAEAASVALRLIAANGGFFVWPVGEQLASASQLPGNALLTWQGILVLFGANFLGHNVGYVAALAALHLVGIGLVAWACRDALRHFAHAELVVQVLVVSVLLSLIGYLVGRTPVDLHSTREFAAVLPCGAALAGRVLASRLRAARLVPALAIVSAGYLLSVGRVVTLPAVPAEGSQVAAWLSAHHLDYGLAGYWQASDVTLDTGTRVQIRPVLTAGLGLVRGNWEAQSSWYDPALHVASFVVVSSYQPNGEPFPLIGNVRATFGQPASVSNVGPYTILVYDRNLLPQLRRQESDANSPNKR